MTIMRMARESHHGRQNQVRRLKMLKTASGGNALSLTFFRAISAGCRRLNDDGLGFIDDRGVAALQALHTSILAPHPVFADLPGLAAREPKWSYPAMTGQNGAFHLFEKTYGATDAVARMPLAAAARSGANVKVLKHHGIAELENLRVGQARIRHMRMDRVRAVKSGARGRTGADRLVVLVALIAEIEIVHGALRGGECSECPEKAVGHRL